MIPDVATMARKNSKAASPPPGDEQREELIAVRCKASYKKWLVRFAKSERTTPSHLVDQGLMQLAKLRGFDLPPER
jgi:hypothetical protein